MTTTLYHYKCYMECIADYSRFMNWHYENIDRENPIYFEQNKLENCKIHPIEAEWEFKSNLQHYYLIKYITRADKEVGDLHKIIESLVPFEDYVD